MRENISPDACRREVRVHACVCQRFTGSEGSNPRSRGFTDPGVTLKVTAELPVSSWSLQLSEVTESGGKEEDDKVTPQDSFRESEKQTALN